MLIMIVGFNFSHKMEPFSLPDEEGVRKVVNVIPNTLGSMYELMQ
jgi:hypothetical protein